MSSTSPEPPARQPQDEEGRVIYLGEVRRRRGTGGRARGRGYLLPLLPVAAVGWALWLAVLLTLHPGRLLTYVAFLSSLFIALTASVAMVASELERRTQPEVRFSVAVRRGAFVAGVVVFNLAAMASHHWSLAFGGISIVAAILLDMALERRS